MLISIVDELRPFAQDARGYIVRMVRESDVESSRGDLVVELQLSHMDHYVTCHTVVDETTASQSGAGLEFHELFETLTEFAAAYPDYGLCWVSRFRDLGEPEGYSVRGVSSVLGWLVRPEHREVLLVRQDFPEVDE